MPNGPQNRRRSTLPTLWTGWLALLLVAASWASDPVSAAPDAQKLARQEFEATLLAGNLEAARQLLASGVDPANSVISASRRGDHETVQWLLDAGADVTGRPGARALLYAVKDEDPTVAELLRSHGAEIDGTDDSGITLLMAMARSDSPHRRTQRALLDAGADVNASSLAGRTPLMFAVSSGRSMDVRLLLERGARVNETDRDGWSALMLAVRSGRLSLVDDLLDAGADPGISSSIGWTPLMWAAWLGRTLIVERLLAAEADPNQGNAVVGSALLRAVQAGRPRIAARLLASGARTDAALAGVDVLGWAKLSGNAALERMIRGAV